MLISLLTIAILILSFMQSKHEDKTASLIFCVPIVIVDLFSSYISGWYYYLFCALCACILINILHKNFNNNLSFIFARLLLLSIPINFLGFVMWFNYMEPTLYSDLFTLYYISIVYILLTHGGLKWLNFYHTVRSALGSWLFSSVRTQK